MERVMKPAVAWYGACYGACWSSLARGMELDMEPDMEPAEARSHVVLSSMKS